MQAVRGEGVRGLVETPGGFKDHPDEDKFIMRRKTDVFCLCLLMMLLMF